MGANFAAIVEMICFPRLLICQPPERNSRSPLTVYLIAPCSQICALSAATCADSAAFCCCRLLVLRLELVVRALGDARGEKGKARLWD